MRRFDLRCPLHCCIGGRLSLLSKNIQRRLYRGKPKRCRWRNAVDGCVIYYTSIVYEHAWSCCWHPRVQLYIVQVRLSAPGGAPPRPVAAFSIGANENTFKTRAVSFHDRAIVYTAISRFFRTSRVFATGHKTFPELVFGTLSRATSNTTS